MKQKLKNCNKNNLFNIRYDVIVCLFIVIVTLAVYWQVSGYDFVNFDDDAYVIYNDYVRKGLTWEGIKWAFNFKDIAYWIPLTWLSHMLDCHLYGLNPGMHHSVNLIFHILNSLLLFFVFNQMTGAIWKSAFIAVLFALHPVNVDSVAWISQRKNVLSTFFGMLTLLTYTYYIRQPSIKRYLLTLLSLILGTMAKPMLITLPCVLLLLDYYPLRRLKFDNNSLLKVIKSQFSIFLEKIPLILSSLFSVLIYSLSVQHNSTVVSMKAVPMKLRIENALVSYISYIGKMIFPYNLSVYYPYPTKIPMWQTAGASLLLILITVQVFRGMRRYPYLLVGWLWYLGTLVPVIGLKQAGLWPAIADRWAYIPFIGLFIMLAWGIPELFSQWKYKEKGLAMITAILILVLMILTWHQVRYWRNSITLFEHALHITAKNDVVHYHLGSAWLEQGNLDKAVKHFEKALQIYPYYDESHNKLGMALIRQGHIEEGIKHFYKALQLNPGSAEIHNNLGVALFYKGKNVEALNCFKEALKIDPNFIDARNNLQKVIEITEHNNTEPVDTKKHL